MTNKEQIQKSLDTIKKEFEKLSGLLEEDEETKETNQLDDLSLMIYKKMKEDINLIPKEFIDYIQYTNNNITLILEKSFNDVQTNINLDNIYEFNQNLIILLFTLKTFNFGKFDAPILNSLLFPNNSFKDNDLNFIKESLTISGFKEQFEKQSLSHRTFYIGDRYEKKEDIFKNTIKFEVYDDSNHPEIYKEYSRSKVKKIIKDDIKYLMKCLIAWYGVVNFEKEIEIYLKSKKKGRTMNKGDKLNELIEKLAEFCHDEQWSGWMNYLFSKCDRDAFGYVTIAPEFAVRWKRQIQTPYKELKEEEKESDRIEAKKILNKLDLLYTTDSTELDFKSKNISDLYDKAIKLLDCKRYELEYYSWPWKEERHQGGVSYTIGIHQVHAFKKEKENHGVVYCDNVWYPWDGTINSDPEHWVNIKEKE